MISERRLKLRVVGGALALAVCSACGYQSWLAHGGFPLWWLGGLLAGAELLRNLHMLALPAAGQRQSASARAGSAGGVTGTGADAELSSLASAWLQHAPIALFRLDLDQPDAPATPLNTSAHRILAYGHLNDRAAIEEKLRAQQIGQRTLVWFDGEHGAERALLTASALSHDGGRQHLLAWMPVENELEAETLSAWRELTHVLTHEIMNSLTPVASLSRTAQELLDAVHNLLPEDVNEDLAIAFATIERRTTSLGQFVDSYRTLSAMPAPQPEALLLEQAFARLSALVGAEWRERGGKAGFSVESPDLEIEADPGQFEQALINLLKNAADATAGRDAPEVHVSARLARGGRVQIDIWDNGPGVPDELAAQIFVPFFSTKERSSGIGLAVVRQLLHSNGGAVRYVKPLRGGAQFSVTF